MSKVNRSVYQALKEENKRLLHDIYILVAPEHTAEKTDIILKWRQKIQKEREFESVLRHAAKIFMEENPEMFKILKPTALCQKTKVNPRKKPTI